jgi:hypothetical protein
VHVVAEFGDGDAVLQPALRARILAGMHTDELRAGERLPSVREIAREYGVSRRAATRAYASLAAEGLIELASRSGAYLTDVGGRGRGPDPRRPEGVVDDESWLVELFAAALRRGIPVAQLPGFLSQALGPRPVRAAVLDGTEDQLWSVCDELRRDYGIDASPADVDTLGDGWDARPCRHAAVLAADLLVTTPYLGPRVRRLGALLGKPVQVVTMCVDLFAEARAQLRRGPVHFIGVDPRFGASVRRVIGAESGLPAGAAATGADGRLRVLVYGRDDLCAVAAPGPVYVTRLARRRMAVDPAARPVLARTLPEARVLSPESARALFRFVLRARPGERVGRGGAMSDAAEREPRVPAVRREQPSTQLSREEFTRRLGERFYDPAFDAVRAEIERVIDVAWEGYHEYRKSPRARKAGPGFADPEHELPVEWLATRDAIGEAQRRHDDPAAPRRILLVSAAARSSQTCPGESPKTYRLAQLARAVLEGERDVECDFLDLSLLTAEYGKQILPCKACAPATRTTRWSR